MTEHEKAVLERLDKIIAALDILTSSVDEPEEDPPCYLDGTPME